VNIRSDCDIQHQIESELLSCSEVDGTDIAVKVTDGVATLTGYVRDFFDKYDAEEAVKRISGVLAVANDILVQANGTKGISDPQIARAAVAAIKRALPESWEKIRPIVRQGIVTLEGMLERSDQREFAERLVRGLDGVLYVVNALGTRSTPPSRHSDLAEWAVKESA
jgi:osmotically-inducible protein OsmY